MMAPRASGPLAGVRVLEVAAIGPAPFTCMLLADLGADVLRIDRPASMREAAAHRGSDDTNVTLRGRPTLEMDLKDAAQCDRFLDLVAHADVLIEGFRPGVMERLGLGPDVCLERRPSLIYGRMTGWGQQGPLAHAAGHDINYIALTGALHAIGPADGKPVVPLNLVGDFGGGALYLALGVVSALYEARGSGRGQVVDAAIVDGTSSLMAMVHGRLAAGVWQDRRGANLLDGGTPWYDTYETADGRFIAVGAIEPRFYDELCRLAGLADAPDASSRRERADELRERLATLFRQRSRDEWARLLEGTDACVAPVLSMSEAATHPHNLARANLVSVDGLVQPAPAPRFSRTPGAIQSPPGRPTESAQDRALRWRREAAAR